MGFFDYRCMISGLSLSSARVALVLLEEIGNDFVPIALPVFGQYNRIGAINGIFEDDSTRRTLEYFQSKINAGEAEIDWKEAYWNGSSLSRIESIEQLIACIERGVTMNCDSVVLKGNRMLYALIDYKIWNAAASLEVEEEILPFTESGIWREIYSQPIPYFDNYTFELKNVQNFLTNHGIPWLPPTDAHQHTDEEINAFLEAATLKFKDNERILKTILE